MSYNEAFMRAHALYKLSESAHEVVVGCATEAPAAVACLRRFHRKPVRPVPVELGDVAAALGVTEAAIRSSALGSDSGVHGLDSLLTSAPVEDLANSVLAHGVAAGASDIYVAVEETETRIRHRIDGVVQDDSVLTGQRGTALAAKLKAMSGMDSLNGSRPQDGRMAVRSAGMRVDVRVSSIPVRGGESLALRLLAARNRPRTLSELGFRIELVEELRRFHRIPSGLAVVCGPSDSGKSTTLHALLSRAVAAGRRVVTVEDPVEYALPGAAQISAGNGRAAHSELLKSALRQSPDVILIGEIRDTKTVNVALRAALTGHLVFATLHAGSPRQALRRLFELGASQESLADSLRCVLCQRLLRRICPNCRGSRVGRRAAAERCEQCAGDGYRGRAAVGELVRCFGSLSPTYNSTEQALRRAAEQAAREALTDEREIERVFGDGKPGGEIGNE